MSIDNFEIRCLERRIKNLSLCLGPRTHTIVKHKQFHLVIQELRFNCQRSSLNFVTLAAKKGSLKKDLPVNCEKDSRRLQTFSLPYYIYLMKL